MKIVHYPHPALRHKSPPLTSIDKQVRIQAGRMLELMYGSRGLGLAANQVALPFQMFVMNPEADPAKRERERVLINPVILDRKGSIEGEEGCLSFPELFQKVRRARSVVVRAYDLEGKSIEFAAVDLEARLAQHEIDHLHGILFIDKMGVFSKRDSMDTLGELERAYRKAQERGDIPSDEQIKKELDAGGGPDALLA